MIQMAVCLRGSYYRIYIQIHRRFVSGQREGCCDVKVYVGIVIDRGIQYRQVQGSKREEPLPS